MKEGHGWVTSEDDVQILGHSEQPAALVQPQTALGEMWGLGPGSSRSPWPWPPVRPHPGVLASLLSATFEEEDQYATGR